MMTADETKTVKKTGDRNNLNHLLGTINSIYDG